ncbi:energy-coupled thiamine transporter ThiT [Halarsenatibacter silvermanii]|uniref:Thiamine transporter n=1 Tax=Halarsenatibacter silvermanii TaxID=321763 RepID=A0A1G9NJ05_9FIRM|nr:energy-coupled thiamine transporter ThiT [Halarsenatibacter silvermanii]SDL86586.1 thiamine transporter [Halarsenatibacter silvermanii]
MNTTRTRIMAEAAVAASLSTVLSFITLWRMPQGGSVNLEMLPILFVAFRHGGGAGIITGLIHGLLQLITGPYIVHPAQLILDYPLAYMMVGIAGILPVFSELGKIKFGRLLFALGLGGGGRLLSHILAGAIFFAEFAPENQNPWIYSFIYNLSHLLPALIISVMVIILLFKQNSELFLQNT